MNRPFGAYLYIMEIIGSKAQLKPYILQSISLWQAGNEDAAIAYLHAHMLKAKVRFPVLEYAAKAFSDAIPQNSQIHFTDRIISLHEIGGNVLAGIILQMHLLQHFKQSLDKAVEYIITGNEWYVCDIIGERVMGHALLTMPVETIRVLRRFTQHDNKWIVRCIGVAAHYAIKKGLAKQYVSEVFAILLSQSGTTEFHTKKGIGWAAKTTAKFHPDIITYYAHQIEEADIKQWFRTKINIGLSRTSKYAHRYTS